MADLVASTREPVEVQVLHVNEVEYETPLTRAVTPPIASRSAAALSTTLVADLRRRGITA